MNNISRDHYVLDMITYFNYFKSGPGSVTVPGSCTATTILTCLSDGLEVGKGQSNEKQDVAMIDHEKKLKLTSLLVLVFILSIFSQDNI